MEEQFVNPEFFNQLNNASANGNAENTDFGLEGFFDNAPSEEMQRNRENVFGILDSVESTAGSISQEEYADLFEEDCSSVLGCGVRKNSRGEILRIRPGAVETLIIKSRYNAIGFSVLVFLLASSLIPYVLIYAAVFGMAFASGSEGFGISRLEELFNNVISSTGGYMLVNAGSVMLSLFLAAYCGCKCAKISPKTFFGRPKIKPAKTLAYASIGYFFQVVANVLITLISIAAAYGGKELNNADFSTKRDVFATIVICVYTVVIAPFAEELFFRGFMLNAASKVSSIFAMVLSSFLFGLYHMNIPQFVMAFLLGMLLSYVTLKADSIIPAIVIHSLNNCISMSLSILSEYNASLGEMVSVIVVYGLAIIGLICLINISTKEALPENTVYDKYRGARIAFTCAPLNIAVIILIIVAALNMFA
ncbi:MAG: CPBP family intramembrane metalloprotease [Oscillospiraceae bacterium]|nr:CPBP family intramembrane metalloprotease [Oscillospiraceae bacterium]